MMYMKKFLLSLPIFAACAAPQLRADAVVTFNEVMYHPSTNEAAMEWVELRNLLAMDVDISEWSISGAINYTFPQNTVIRGRGYLVVAISPATLMANTGLSGGVGPFTGRLGNNGEILTLPLLGKVAAGSPIEAFEHDEFIQVPPDMVRNPSKSYALKVSGSSMIEDGIFDGDLILVQKQASASNGEIVVASIDNESTVKRFFSPKGPEKKIELRPANSTMQSMWYEPDQVDIQGVVVGLIRRF